MNRDAEVSSLRARGSAYIALPNERGPALINLIPYKDIIKRY